MKVEGVDFWATVDCCHHDPVNLQDTGVGPDKNAVSDNFDTNRRLTDGDSRRRDKDNTILSEGDTLS